MDRNVYNSGYKPSVLDGTEHIFGTTVSNQIKIPDSYSYKKYLPEVLNQGQLSICVPCSVSAFLNWRENLNNGHNRKDNEINYFEIYNSKTTEGDGMTFKDAFRFLRHEGVSSNLGKLKIDEYALLRDAEKIKVALVMNGPCVGALPVYNNTKEFWNQRKYDRFLGYHAIAIVGYDKHGFIIRNSWGKSFGTNGYTTIKYEDAYRFVEMWTIIE
jgi:hypothetical protein